MPVTAGPVPGMTSDLRTIRLDPRHFRVGRWFLLAEGVLLSAFGSAGLVSAVLHPHAGHSGAPVLGFASTPAHSAVLLALGVAAIAAVRARSVAVTVTAASALANMMLLFFSAVGTTRAKPTLLGFHAADVLFHGVLAVVNLALLMWLIPDELGDPVWVPRRRRGRDRQQAPPVPKAVSEPTATHFSVPSAPTASPPQHSVPRGQASRPASSDPPAINRQTRAIASLTVPVAAAVLAAVVCTVIWLRRRPRR